MKQFTTPIIIKNNLISSFEKISLNSDIYNEQWIQDVCFQSPNILPVEEIEPAFSGMIPICKELDVASGSIDLIYLNEYGFISIGECKLWRNPEARRKVVGQILDYAKDIAKWDYLKFEKECIKSREENEKSLFEIVQGFYPEIDEQSFIDNVQKNLSKGRFLLSIIGDGIRENMEELSNYIHRNTNLNFTLALIELPVYKNPNTDELVITPRILAKTKEIERIIFRYSDEKDEEKQKTVINTVSEKVFFERLKNSIGAHQTNNVREFIEHLSTELNIISKLGRGKRLSLNLKSSNDNFNFASIQENGEVWFYGIVTKTEELGNKQIGINYLKKLADIIGGKFDNKYKEWLWCVKKDGNYISIVDYLKSQENWKKLISDTLDEINDIEEEN